MTEFVKQKGMSFLLTKRIGECTPDEKAYKLAYSRHIKQRYIARKTPEKNSEYNSKYNKEYYTLHRYHLRDKARVRIALKRGTMPTSTTSRGRTSKSGITVHV
jgi:hypothetical protein